MIKFTGFEQVKQSTNLQIFTVNCLCLIILKITYYFNHAILKAFEVNQMKTMYFVKKPFIGSVLMQNGPLRTEVQLKSSNSLKENNVRKIIEVRIMQTEGLEKLNAYENDVSYDNAIYWSRLKRKHSAIYRSEDNQMHENNTRSICGLHD